MTRIQHAVGLSGALALAALTGCSHDHDVDFRFLTEADPEIQVTSELIVVPEGMAVGVEAIAVEDDDRIDDEVDFVPLRPGIIGMDRGLDERSWIFYGIAAGSTGVEVYFNDDFVLELRAEVVEQTP